MCVSAMQSIVYVSNRYFLSVSSVPGIADEPVNMTDAFSPPGACLLVGAAMQRASTEMNN